MKIEIVNNQDEYLYFAVPQEENYKYFLGISKKFYTKEYAEKKFKEKIKQFYIFNKKRNGGINPQKKGFKIS